MIENGQTFNYYLDRPCHFKIFNLFTIRKISVPNEYDNLLNELKITTEEVKLPCFTFTYFFLESEEIKTQSGACCV